MLADLICYEKICVHTHYRCYTYMRRGEVVRCERKRERNSRTPTNRPPALLHVIRVFDSVVRHTHTHKFVMFTTSRVHSTLCIRIYIYIYIDILNECWSIRPPLYATPYSALSLFRCVLFFVLFCRWNTLTRVQYRMGEMLRDINGVEGGLRTAGYKLYWSLAVDSPSVPVSHSRRT